MTKFNFRPPKPTLPVPDPPNIDEMTTVEYLVWRESNPESPACVPEIGIVSATAAEEVTTDPWEELVIPPQGYPPPHPIIPVRAPVTVDKEEISP